ncbi:AbrB/MazE/SpoVT family DNA-binding domain-containing protein, partial [Candidatus Woesearchaeota archaeon]|nr:AbrB/MazE/SpoVT family DNA-binding domain-containing protein [Candidatus Woesearchaeota archaeon]
MKRKVIQIADSTQLVSLPRQWAKQQGIKKGDEIEVEVRGSTITIKAGESGKPDLGKVIIDVSGLDRSSIMFAIRAAYRKGYDEIEVHFQSTTAPYYRIGKDLK